MEGKRIWGRVREMIYSAGTYNETLPTAMFDFDSTLHVFKKRGPDPNLSRRLLALLAESFNIVIISNRADNSAEPLKEYVGQLDTTMPGLATVYAPTAHDRDRKPHTGTWEHLRITTNEGVTKRFVFYCGDAAGRPGDFAHSDYAFALNIGVPFIVPEALFGYCGGRMRGCELWKEPSSYGCQTGNLNLVTGPPVDLEPIFVISDTESDTESEPEIDPILTDNMPIEDDDGTLHWLVIMVGAPGSGKSRIASRLVRERGFTLVSRDIQGGGYIQTLKNAIHKNESIVVDNTNPRITDRAYIIHILNNRRAIATYQIRIVHVATPIEVCHHLNNARCEISGRYVPPIAMRVFTSHFDLPTHAEAKQWPTGRLITIPFVLDANMPEEITTFRY